MGLVYFIIGLATMICMLGLVIGMLFLISSIPILAKLGGGIILLLIIIVVPFGIYGDCKEIGEDIVKSFKNRKGK